MLDVERIVLWSPWQPLLGSWIGARLPNLPGLYRIRGSESDGLDYVGQTGTGGMTLRKRLAMLAGVFDEAMPYRDRHAAAPALWALRHAFDCSFEVSVAPLAGNTSRRKGLNALAVALYRQSHGSSPTANFGRIPPGYRIPTSNVNRLAAIRRRFRGGPSDEETPNHLPSIVPAGALTEEPVSPTWCGHDWSPWTLLADAPHQLDTSASGLYRIRRTGAPSLVYIGQGVIRARLLAHHRRAVTGSGAQHQVFAENAPLECSWVAGTAWHPHERLELENDLIASHVLMTEDAPPAQFLG